MFRGHILWERSGNKKHHSYVAWRLQGPLDNVKKQSKPKCACLCNSHDFKENFVILGDPTYDFSVLGLGNIVSLQWRICIWWPSSPVTSHTISLFWRIIRYKFCYMLTALPSSRIQKSWASLFYMAKRLVRENATTTATQQMLLIFIPLSPHYEAFNNAMVQYHHQN